MSGGIRGRIEDGREEVTPAPIPGSWRKEGVDMGAKLAIRSNAWLFSSFAGEFSDRSQSYAGKGGVRIAW